MGIDESIQRRQIVGVKVYTVRDLDRVPSNGLDVCDREGEVKIRRRDGRTYTVRADSAAGRMISLPDFRGRMMKIFPKPIPASQSKLVDKLIAGE
jgi:hypothetical protein